MKANTVLVRHADRMMTSITPVKSGLQINFADGARGLVPFDQIPEIDGLQDVVKIDLPNPFEVAINTAKGESVSLPWDFARHYCDASYRPRVEAIAGSDRRRIGERVRQLRNDRGLTQQALADAAGVGRVTLVRTETGEYLPRFSTLDALAKALGVDVRDLLADLPDGPRPR